MSLEDNNMKIYIPEHLRKLDIIDQLYLMISEYSSIYADDNINQTSLSDYQKTLISDPVKNFIRLCINKEDIRDDEDYEEVINYLSKLFYSVKGTIKVFEYMSKFLNLDLDGDIIFDSKEITINFKSLNVSNESLFFNSLRLFLDSLICYIKLNTNISSINLTVEGEFINYVGGNIRSYKNIITELYEIDY